MLTLDEVQIYNATRGSFAEGESLIEIIRVTHEEVTKSLARAQAYQARKYNKSVTFSMLAIKPEVRKY